MFIKNGNRKPKPSYKFQILKRYYPQDFKLMLKEFLNGASFQNIIFKEFRKNIQNNCSSGTWEYLIKLKRELKSQKEKTGECDYVAICFTEKVKKQNPVNISIYVLNKKWFSKILHSDFIDRSDVIQMNEDAILPDYLVNGYFEKKQDMVLFNPKNSMFIIEHNMHNIIRRLKEGWVKLEDNKNYHYDKTTKTISFNNVICLDMNDPQYNINADLPPIILKTTPFPSSYEFKDKNAKTIYSKSNLCELSDMTYIALLDEGDEITPYYLSKETHIIFGKQEFFLNLEKNLEKIIY